MADNTSRARDQLAGQRKAVRDHAKKWHEQKETYEKDFAWKTIQNAQSQIAKLKDAHPSLREASREDSWRPGDRGF